MLFTSFIALNDLASGRKSVFVLCRILRGREGRSRTLISVQAKPRWHQGLDAFAGIPTGFHHSALGWLRGNVGTTLGHHPAHFTNPESG